MIEVKGDLFELVGKVEWLCITTNGSIKRDGCGVMGRGCALQAKQRWPGIDQILGQRLKQCGNIAMPLIKVQDPTVIWSFPVKHEWDQMADLNLIKQSAEKLVQIIGPEEFEVVIPRPGCGNGGLRWDDVKKVIAPILDERFKIISNE